MELSYKRLSFIWLELWSAKQHATSFNTTRATYLSPRISALCYVWAFLTLAWIPVDVYLLGIQSHSLVTLRVILAFTVFIIGQKASKHGTLPAGRLAIAAFVVSVNCFYLFANSTLDYQHSVTSTTYFYTLLPFVHIVLLAIFPLTIRESLSFMAFTAAVQLHVDASSGALFKLEEMAIYWLQTVVGLMVIWAQTSKVHMMLRLYRHATLDPLTGVYNKRMLLTLAKRDFENTRFKSRPYSVLIMDLDRFKRVNDRYGHFAGDVVLKAFSDSVQQTLRKSDIFGRFGGEEFILFLPHCSTTNAKYVANRIMQNIQDLDIAVEGLASPINITTSIGIATSESFDDDFSTLLEKADAALYRAKDKGRNCALVFDAKAKESKDNCRRPWIEYAS
ncbi:GGDEF domain-containing protein [Enterovibrio sp. Hal110]